MGSKSLSKPYYSFLAGDDTWRLWCKSERIFTNQWLWRMQPCQLWHHVVWKKSTDVFSGFNHNPATNILQFCMVLLFFFVTSKLQQTAWCPPFTRSDIVCLFHIKSHKSCIIQLLVAQEFIAWYLKFWLYHTIMKHRVPARNNHAVSKEDVPTWCKQF